MWTIWELHLQLCSKMERNAEWNVQISSKQQKGCYYWPNNKNIPLLTQHPKYLHKARTLHNMHVKRVQLKYPKHSFVWTSTVSAVEEAETKHHGRWKAWSEHYKMMIMMTRDRDSKLKWSTESKRSESAQSSVRSYLVWKTALHSLLIKDCKT